MNEDVTKSLMKVLISLKTLSDDSIVGICGTIQTEEQAVMLVEKIKINPQMSESEIIKEALKLRNQNVKNDMFFENRLRSLGFSWITIAEAMSDENKDKTISLLIKNPKISKTDFLKEMNIEEVKYN